MSKWCQTKIRDVMAKYVSPNNLFIIHGKKYAMKRNVETFQMVCTLQ